MPSREGNFPRQAIQLYWHSLYFQGRYLGGDSTHKREFVKHLSRGDIEAEGSPKINPKIRDLNFTMLA